MTDTDITIAVPIRLLWRLVDHTLDVPVAEGRECEDCIEYDDVDAATRLMREQAPEAWGALLDEQAAEIEALSLWDDAASWSPTDA
jgi:hypothetical protein